jgi:hypothetical protein
MKFKPIIQVEKIEGGYSYHLKGFKYPERYNKIMLKYCLPSQDCECEKPNKGGEK